MAGSVPAVDAVIPAYNERPEALEATLSACLRQTCPPETVFVVDDCSGSPVRLPRVFVGDERVRLLRLEQNSGVSAARNAAQRRATPRCASRERPSWRA